MCSATSAPNGTPCDDGNACTGGDTCQNGACVGGDPVICGPLDACHVAGVCDPGTGLCSNPNAPDGTACDDGDPCAQSDSCQGGVCVSSNPISCTALDQCHDAGTCDPATGQCSNPAKPDGSACDDGDACTQRDSCLAGACVGADPVACPVPNGCHDPGICDRGTGICSQPTLKPGYCSIEGQCIASGTAKPGDPCQVCDPAVSSTSWSSAFDGKSCSDNNACTNTDTCQGGVCTPGTAVACDPPSDCQQPGVCNPHTGLCEYLPEIDGTLCASDGDLCTVDLCEAGACVHTPRDCDDFNPCTIDSCNPVSGACEHEPIECDDGDACTVDSCVDGACVHEPLDCSGDDPCVVFGCDPEFGCTQEPVECDDGNVCTDDFCNEEGECVHVMVECGDVSCSTSVGCDPDFGCQYQIKECPDGTSLDLETCECKPDCQPDETECGGTCVDLKTDSDNCGACGRKCEPDPAIAGCDITCKNGRCDWTPTSCNGAACCAGRSCCVGNDPMWQCCLGPGGHCLYQGNQVFCVPD